MKQLSQAYKEKLSPDPLALLPTYYTFARIKGTHAAKASAAWWSVQAARRRA